MTLACDRTRSSRFRKNAGARSQMRRASTACATAMGYARHRRVLWSSIARRSERGLAHCQKYLICRLRLPDQASHPGLSLRLQGSLIGIGRTSSSSPIVVWVVAVRTPIRGVALRRDRAIRLSYRPVRGSRGLVCAPNRHSTCHRLAIRVDRLHTVALEWRRRTRPNRASSSAVACG